MIAIEPGRIWGVIPARGGSKSIPLKNLAPLAGRPLLDYIAAAAKDAAVFDRLLCDTDSPEIAEHGSRLGLEIRHRPAELGRDSTRVDDVVTDLIITLAEAEGQAAEFLVLMQATSPFVAPADIAACCRRLVEAPDLSSVQTVGPVPHHFHAVNQRELADGRLRFVAPEARDAAYNKQRVPPRYVFGGVVGVRVSRFLEHGRLFAPPSGAVIVDEISSFDADGPLELAWAEALIAAGLVAHLRR